MRHTLLYNSTILLVTARNTVPRFQCFTELHEAYPIHHTDWPHVLAYERNQFLRAGLLSCHRPPVVPQASCRAAGNILVTDGAKYVSRRGCFAEVPHIMPYSLGGTFWRCSLKLLVVEWLANSSLTWLTHHLLYTGTLNNI